VDSALDGRDNGVEADFLFLFTYDSDQYDICVYLLLFSLLLKNRVHFTGDYILYIYILRRYPSTRYPHNRVDDGQYIVYRGVISPSCLCSIQLLYLLYIYQYIYSLSYFIYVIHYIYLLTTTTTTYVVLQIPKNNTNY
jgi:hypothetical protein